MLGTAGTYGRDVSPNEQNRDPPAAHGGRNAAAIGDAGSSDSGPRAGTGTIGTGAAGSNQGSSSAGRADAGSPAGGEPGAAAGSGGRGAANAGEPAAAGTDANGGAGGMGSDVAGADAAGAGGPTAGSAGVPPAANFGELIDRLSRTLTDEQRLRFLQAQATGTMTPMLLMELITAINEADACNGGHQQCQLMCLQILTGCQLCQRNAFTYASLLQECNGL